MAFEERCSPNQASSPSPVNGRVPHIPGMTTEYNPKSQYTCTTIDQRFSQDLPTMVKIQPTSPPPSVHSPDFYYEERSESPQEVKPIINHFSHEARQQVPVAINFSINKILHPEFGLKAIRRTSKIEGPKSVGPNHSILYKPYELSRKSTGDAATIQPLGGLKQTISQIGHSSPAKELDLSKGCEQRRPDSASSMVSSSSSATSSQTESGQQQGNSQLWPAWVYCTRYSDRPSSGPRSRRNKRLSVADEKRPRTAFSSAQLARLKNEFNENKYLNERRRQSLASELGLAEAQIKIWFQNKRAKIKKSTGHKNPLAIQLMAQGLYNHKTANESEDEEEISVT